MIEIVTSTLADRSERMISGVNRREREKEKERIRDEGGRKRDRERI